MTYAVGSLVKARGREWVVLPESEADFLLLRPLAGSDDEIAGLHAAGSYSSAAGLQEEMRAKACEVGADAVVITRDFIPGTQASPAVMTGTAVKYREPAAGK